MTCANGYFLTVCQTWWKGSLCCVSCDYTCWSEWICEITEA